MSVVGWMDGLSVREAMQVDGSEEKRRDAPSIFGGVGGR